MKKKAFKTNKGTHKKVQMATSLKDVSERKENLIIKVFLL